MLISNGLSTMGFALPAAIGAALLDRDRPVVALTGDGGLLMCVGELLTAARESLRIIVIVFSDASLSLIEIKQQASVSGRRASRSARRLARRSRRASACAAFVRRRTSASLARADRAGVRLSTDRA